MKKKILITGATDGIGLETARMLVKSGNNLLIHGRNSAKIEKVQKELLAYEGERSIECYQADLSSMVETKKMVVSVLEKHQRIDVLINNAGVFSANDSITSEGLDVRFAVNTIAPYLLTKQLLPLLGIDGRVINVSSAAQASVDLEIMAGRGEKLSGGAAYAQSKLAITMWSRNIVMELGNDGPVIIAVNPASMLGSKMVKEAYGVNGSDLRIGADILTRAATSEEFATASGKYYDNDIRNFSSPHPDALDPLKCKVLCDDIDTILKGILG